MTSASPNRRIIFAVLTAVTFLVVAASAPGVGAQSDDTLITTSTLPTDNRQMGEIIPKPFTGMEPQDPGDPGGWLQVSLFFLLVGAILAIVAAVWWTSRRARQRRDAAGYDPVELARRRGEGVRRPRSAGAAEQS